MERASLEGDEAGVARLEGRPRDLAAAQRRAGGHLGDELAHAHAQAAALRDMDDAMDELSKSLFRHSLTLGANAGGIYLYTVSAGAFSVIVPEIAVVGPPTQLTSSVSR